MLTNFTTYKRVLVTGAGGVLGTALLSLLGKYDDLEIASPTRNDCDLLDQRAVESYFEAFQPDLIFHLAGKVFGVQGNLNFGGQSFYENSKMNLNVVEAARKVNTKKLVAAGTTAIYSDIAPLPMKEKDLWLGAPHGSEGPYGHAKRGMLAQLESYQTQYGLQFCYLILTNLYGPNDRFDEQFGHVVPSLVSRFSKARDENLSEVVCWGDGSPTRDFLFALDAARAFLFAAEKGTGPMNVATGNAVPIRELVNAISEQSGFQGKIAWDLTKPMGQKMRSYDVSKILALGWTPEYDIQTGVKATLDWFQANKDLLRL